MCSIFASFNQNKFYELAELNSYRGSHSFSISYFDVKTKRLCVSDKGLGKMPRVKLDAGYYYIGHCQAPTTSADDISSIHPAKDKGDYLYHNGIIKEKQIKQWQDEWNFDWKWDTKWLLYLMNTGVPMKVLSETDGSFACIHYGKYNQYLHMFRNDNAPMFMNGTDISSTKFDNAISLPSNIIYELRENQWLSTDKTFTTKNCYYWNAGRTNTNN